VNWDAIGAIAEAVGAFAVVVTLIYLSMQIRQNSKVISLNETSFALQNFRERSGSLRELNMNAMNSSWLWPVFEKLVRALPDGDIQYTTISITGASSANWEHALNQLTIEERGRFFFYNLTAWNNCQNMFYEAALPSANAYALNRVKRIIDSQVTKWKALGIPFREDDEFDRYCSKALQERDAAGGLRNEDI
jgi:hypothetical protein